MTWDGIERRKRMSEFEPQTAFEGYVVGVLENIKEQLKVLPCGETSKRLGKVENDLANIKGKVTIIGAVSGVVTAFFTKYILGK